MTQAGDSARLLNIGVHMSSTENATWNRLEQNWAKGFASLQREEQETLALWWLESETMNGTLNQFFWNSSGDLALLALAGLKNLTTPVTLAAFNSALAYFGDDYPCNRELRMAKLELLEAQYGADLFTPASRIIQDLPEDFVGAALQRLALVYASSIRV